MQNLTKKRLLTVLLLLATVTLFHACKTTSVNRNSYRSANALIHQTEQLKTKPFLKAHMKNGDVFILTESWELDTAHLLVLGSGTRYDLNRAKVKEGMHRLPVDSVLIFETNDKIINSEDGRVAALSILTGLDVALGIFCLTNPKACFGSCPTFYIENHDYIHHSDAEGFSNAISPSMEYSDIDALDNAPLISNTFVLRMKNEALETHCVKSLQLIAAPRAEGQRVFHARDNSFYRSNHLLVPSSVRHAEDDVTALFAKADREEWFSLADPQNMASKEELFFEFDAHDFEGSAGVLVHFRQTLMTTFLIYNAMGYMGDQVSDIFAAIEANSQTREQLNRGIHGELGEIDLFMWDEAKNGWIFQGGLYETGPIAINKQIVPLKNEISGQKIKLKFVLNKGLWRIDHVALANIAEKVEPIVLNPTLVKESGSESTSALAALISNERHLISMPGDVYSIFYELPDNEDYELFLNSRGYYLQWMRESWLRDKDLLTLRQMIRKPAKYLKNQAANYKAYEKTMEEAFWGSRIEGKVFTHLRYQELP
jgi:hypothetical protein